MRINNFFLFIVILQVLFATNINAMLQQELLAEQKPRPTLLQQILLAEQKPRPTLLQQILLAEQKRRPTSRNYENYINFFLRTLESQLNKIKLDKYSIQDDLLEKQGMEKRKICSLKNILQKPNYLIFNPQIHTTLKLMAKQKLENDAFAGKIQLLFKLDANKNGFRKMLLIRKESSANRVNTKIFEEITNEDMNDYENQQYYLFFDILADLILP